jgi:hypothetical protein
MRRLTVLGLALVVLAAAAPAGAAVRTVTRVPGLAGLSSFPGSLTGIALSAGRVTWAERRGRAWQIRADGKGTLAVRPSLPTELFRVIALTGSPTALGVTDTASDVTLSAKGDDAYFDHQDDRVLAGLAGARLQGLFSCGERGIPGQCALTCDSGQSSRFELFLGTTALAMVDRCDFDAGELVVRDLATGAPRFRMPVAGRSSVAMAGEYIALGTTDGIRVLDARTGADVYVIAERDAPTFRGLDVQADGTVAAIVGSFGPHGYERRITWASPAAPVLHTVATTSADDLRIDGDRILAHTVHRLVLYRLDGHAVTLAREPRSLGYGQILVDDLDPRRATWTTRTCDGDRVHVEDDVARARPAPPARGERCGTFEVARGSLRPTADGRVHIVLSCPNGCTGEVDLTTQARDEVPVVVRVRHPRPARRVVVTITRRDGRLEPGPATAEFHGRDRSGHLGWAARHTTLGSARP